MNPKEPYLLITFHDPWGTSVMEFVTLEEAVAEYLQTYSEFHKYGSSAIIAQKVQMRMEFTIGEETKTVGTED